MQNAAQGYGGLLLFANHFFRPTASPDQARLPPWVPQGAEWGGGGEVELVVRWYMPEGSPHDAVLLLSDAADGRVLGIPTHPSALAYTITY